MATLRELFYFDRDTMEMDDDKLYEPRDDESPMKYNDTRKTRLTLRSINKIRIASEKHDEDAAKELHFVRQMYGIPPGGQEAI